MRILMLEKNVLLDRRVVLMAQSLIKKGHEVKIVHAQAGPGLMERSNVDIETIPFPTTSDLDFSYEGSGFLRKPDFVREVERPFFKSKRRLYERYDIMRNGLQARRKSQFLARIELALRNSWVTFDMAKDRKGQPIKRRLLRFIFGIMSIPTRVRIMKDDEYDTIAPAGVRLDYWDKCVLGFIEKVWQPDVITANDYPTLRVAVAAKKRMKCEIVYDAHELYAYQPGMEFDRSKRIFREERALLNNVKYGIVLNKAQASIMKRDSGWNGTYAICPNATNTPDDFDIRVRHNRVRDRLGIPESHKIMMFQGGINKLRRTDYILKGLAEAKTKNVHMVFLTFGIEVQEYQELAAELGIASRVHFLPFMPWDEIIYWAASVECGMMPYAVRDQNSAIGSPNKMFEFINAGTPMIGPWIVPGIRNMLQDEGFGIAVPLYEVEDFSIAIDEFFDESKGGWKRFRPAMVEGAHKFHWDSQVKNVLAMYDSIKVNHKRRVLKDTEFTAEAFHSDQYEAIGFHGQSASKK